MGIGGLSLAFKKASVAFNHQAFLAWSAFGFAILALIVFALLFVCYGAKILYYFKAFKADLTHQVKINFLLSIPISMLIITAFWSDFRKFLCGECFTAYFKLICDEFLV